MGLFIHCLGFLADALGGVTASSHELLDLLHGARDTGEQFHAVGCDRDVVLDAHLQSSEHSPFKHQLLNGCFYPTQSCQVNQVSQLYSSRTLAVWLVIAVLVWPLDVLHVYSYFIGYMLVMSLLGKVCAHQSHFFSLRLWGMGQVLVPGQKALRVVAIKITVLVLVGSSSDNPISKT